jgi:hypothetical protein
MITLELTRPLCKDDNPAHLMGMKVPLRPRPGPVGRLLPRRDGMRGVEIVNAGAVPWRRRPSARATGERSIADKAVAF